MTMTLADLEVGREGGDFEAKKAHGKTLVLEVKGVIRDQNNAKRSELARRVKGVNAKGGFGQWATDVLFQPAGIHDVLNKHSVGAT